MNKKIDIALASTSLMLSKVEVIGPYVEFIYCACGCGKTTSKYIMVNDKPKKNRPKKFKKGHADSPHSEEFRKKLSEAQTGSNNILWKGDDAGYVALHNWVRRHFWPTRLCQMCMLVPPDDLANITKIYNRDFKNWRYACTKCHIKFDKKCRERQ